VGFSGRFELSISLRGRLFAALPLGFLGSLFPATFPLTPLLLPGVGDRRLPSGFFLVDLLRRRY
jgi:hypothetical protein